MTDWPNAIAQPIDESCDDRPVRFRDITVTPAPSGMDPRHATTPLLGEATNPIDATIADAGGGSAGRREVAATSPRPTDEPITPPQAIMDRRVHAHRGLGQG